MTITSDTELTVARDAELDEQRSALLEVAERELNRLDELVAYLEDKIIRQELAYRHLEAALESSRRIGAAIGILMAHRKITEEAAFAVLARTSQHTNRKLRLVADDVLMTGTV